MQLFLNRSESEFGEACMVFGCQKTICFLMFFVYLILGVNLLQFLLHLQLITLQSTYTFVILSARTEVGWHVEWFFLNPYWCL